MKKIFITALAALLILSMSACVNIGADLGGLLDQPGVQEALSQVDLGELAEQLHVDELADQLGIGDVIDQMLPQAEPEKTPEIPEGAVTDPEQMQFKTIGDAMDAATEWYCRGRGTTSVYTFVFDLDGVPYRVSSTLDEELQKTFDEMDWAESSEENNKAREELERSLPITSEEDLSQYYPDQETLDSWVGMTGKVLEDAGFSINGYSNDDRGEYMEVEKGLFTYIVYTNEPFSEDEDSDRYAEFYKMTVKEMQLSGISYLAMDMEIVD